MTGWFQGTGDILSALAAGDSWMLSEAMRQPAIWPLGLIAMLAAAAFLLVVYHFVPWIERNFEKTVMVVSYLAIGGIIFVEVFRRFVLCYQHAALLYELRPGCPCFRLLPHFRLLC